MRFEVSPWASVPSSDMSSHVFSGRAAGPGSVGTNFAGASFDGREAKSTEKNMAEVSFKDYVDAQDEKTRAQNDAALARLEGQVSALGGKIDGLAGSLKNIPTIGSIAVTGITIALGALAIAFAGWSYGGTTFGLGLSVSPALEKLQAEQREIDRAQDAKLDLILKGIENLQRGQE